LSVINLIIVYAVYKSTRGVTGNQVRSKSCR
jgi:hypothetical protein